MRPIIIDRRKNPGQKNLSNRERFIERFRGRIKEAARKHIGERRISDTGDQEIILDKGGIDEPRFRHTRDDGQWDYVLPGNEKHVAGDTIDKDGGGEESGSEASPSGDGEDEFSFYISYDEYLDMIFDDLELPELIKRSEKSIPASHVKHAGYTNFGAPTNLNIERTAIAGLSRRIALRAPKHRRVLELEEELQEAGDDRKVEILEEIELLRARARAISFLDNVDMRYNAFARHELPTSQAVMICIMDVSGSMGEREKTISKKFFLLLNLFLKRQYENTDVVFVRHHHEAEVCDEDRFFGDRATGGTIVSSAYATAVDVIKQKYPASEWNVYVAQCSDGDNYPGDEARCAPLLEELLDMCWEKGI